MYLNKTVVVIYSESRVCVVTVQESKFFKIDEKTLILLQNEIHSIYKGPETYKKRPKEFYRIIGELYQLLYHSLNTSTLVSMWFLHNIYQKKVVFNKSGLSVCR